MFERFRGRQILYGGAVVAGGLALAGCGQETQPQVRSHIGSNPMQRLEFDYLGKEVGAGFFTSDVSNQDCLKATPYDPSPVGNKIGRVPALLTTVEKAGRLVIRVTPARREYPDATPLELVGLSDQEHYLQPADHESAQILKNYGCDPNLPSGQ